MQAPAFLVCHVRCFRIQMSFPQVIVFDPQSWRTESWSRKGTWSPQLTLQMRNKWQIEDPQHNLGLQTYSVLVRVKWIMWNCHFISQNKSSMGCYMYSAYLHCCSRYNPISAQLNEGNWIYTILFRVGILSSEEWLSVVQRYILNGDKFFLIASI